MEFVLGGFCNEFTLKFRIQTSLSVAPKLPVFARSGEKCEKFSTPLGFRSRDLRSSWSAACDEFLRFTPSATPADLLAATISFA